MKAFVIERRVQVIVEDDVTDDDLRTVFGAPESALGALVVADVILVKSARISIDVASDVEPSDEPPKPEARAASEHPADKIVPKLSPAPRMVATPAAHVVDVHSREARENAKPLDPDGTGAIVCPEPTCRRTFTTQHGYEVHRGRSHKGDSGRARREAGLA